MIALVAAWVAEVLAVLFVLAADPPLVLPAAATHVAAAWLAGLGFGRGGRDAALYHGALVLALPGLGLPGVSVIRWWLARAAAPAGMYAGAHAAIAHLPAPDSPPESLDRIFEWVQSELAVQPLADVIRSGDPKMQRWAIELLGRRADPGAVELLRLALVADDRGVQVAASTALGALEERLAQRIVRAQERATATPESPPAWLALAEACRAYQVSGLLEAVMTAHWRARAEEAYRRTLALAPSLRGAMLGLARTLLARSELAEAEGLARGVREREPALDADVLLAEILFTRGRFADLGAACREAVQAGRRDDLLAWWAGA